MSNDSTQKPRPRKAATDRPKKPYPDFPLTPHASGAWQKKIRGKIHYFGKWAKRVNGKLTRIEGDGWKEALEIYKAQADDLHAGRTPRAKGGSLTVAGLCNAFLTSRLRKLDGGEIGPKMFGEYKMTTDRLISAFGKDRLVDDLAAEDFEKLRADLSKQYGPVRLGNEVQKVRTAFKYGAEAGLIDKPVRFGSQFRKPTKTMLRKHRATGGKRLFTVVEIRQLLDKAGKPLKAMILLGINCAFGNADVSDVPKSVLDLESGWVSFPRGKTGIERRCWLWPETVEALKNAIAQRPDPRNPADSKYAFITVHGHRWVRTSGPDHTPINAVALEFGKLLRSLGIGGRRGLGFYSLRHTFRTIADATKDFPAVRLVMGHADDSIDDVYREGIEDSRLQVVADHVRQWLFGKAPDGGTNGTDGSVPELREPRDSPKQRRGNDVPTLKLYAG